MNSPYSPFSHHHPPTRSAFSRVSKTCRGAPLLRAVMGSLSHKRRKARTKQPSTHSMDVGVTTEPSSPPRIRSSNPHHLHSNGIPQQQQEQQLSQYPSIQAIASSSSSSSSSIPIPFQKISPLTVDDTISHESVDWTSSSTTEATSFSSEHDDEGAAVAVPNKKQQLLASTIAPTTNDYHAKSQHNNNNDRINGDENNSHEEENHDELDDTNFAVQNDYRSSDKKEVEAVVEAESTFSSSVLPSTTSSFTCNTSECAMKILPRDVDDEPSWNDLPQMITLIKDDDVDSVRNNKHTELDDTTWSDHSSPESSMSPLTSISQSRQPDLPQQLKSRHPTTYPTTLRLEEAEVMLDSYRNTLRSNEHLIESLEQTLMETRESAQELCAQRNRLKQELEETLNEEEDWLGTEANGGILRQIHTVLLTLSLLYTMLGGSHYILIFVAMVYLLEDIMTMCGW
jgi:hypothetical protein